MARSLAMLSILGLIIGGIDLYNFQQNRKRATMSCAELIKSGTQARDLTLTNCQIDFSNTLQVTTTSKQGKSKRYYVPVYAAGVHAEPALFVSVVKPERLEMVKGLYQFDKFKMMGLRGNAEKKRYRAYRQKYAGKWQATETIRGLGFRYSTNDKFGRLFLRYQPKKSGFTVVLRDAKPSMGKSVYILGAGIFGMLLAGFLWFRGRTH